MEVRREDQEKINRFSSLHQKETALEEELRGKIVRSTSHHMTCGM
jgi:prefoldin subunit 4